jgi:hypothetical protein
MHIYHHRVVKSSKRMSKLALNNLCVLAVGYLFVPISVLLYPFISILLKYLSFFMCIWKGSACACVYMWVYVHAHVHMRMFN